MHVASVDKVNWDGMPAPTFTRMTGQAGKPLRLSSHSKMETIIPTSQGCCEVLLSLHHCLETEGPAGGHGGADL